MDADLSTPLLIEEALASAARLRVAWPWLAEALIPGTVTVVERTQDPRDVIRDRDEHRRDREAAFAATKAGIVPSGPHPAALRIAPVNARAKISADVRQLAETLWTSARGEVLAVFADPTTRTTAGRCRRCAGVGWLPDPAPALDVPPADRAPECLVCRSTGPCPCGTGVGVQPPVCPACESRGNVPTGIACVVCRAVEPCRCDLADAVMTVGLRVILDVLPSVTDADIAAEALRVLDRSDHWARRVAGVGEDRRIIKAPCPACGRRGDFYAEVSDTDRRKWVVRCDWAGCFCLGAGCSCGRPVRYRGRRHLWPAAEWNALAEKLGVDLVNIGARRVKPRSPA